MPKRLRTTDLEHFEPPCFTVSKLKQGVQNRICKAHLPVQTYSNAKSVLLVFNVGNAIQVG
jgi:hypothetical protein